MGKPKTAKKTVKKPAAGYLITLTHGHNGQVFTSSAPTFEEAFEKLQGPNYIVATTHFKVEHDGKKWEQHFPTLRMRQFMRPAFRKTWAHQIEPFIV